METQDSTSTVLLGNNDTVSRTSTAVTRRDDYRDNVNPGTQSASDGYLYGMRSDWATDLTAEILDGPLSAQGNFGPTNRRLLDLRLLA